MKTCVHGYFIGPAGYECCDVTAAEEVQNLLDILYDIWWCTEGVCNDPKVLEMLRSHNRISQEEFDERWNV